jgi:hypothetical protein
MGRPSCIKALRCVRTENLLKLKVHIYVLYYINNMEVRLWPSMASAICPIIHRGLFHERDISDFSVGYSSVIEFGQSLLSSWEQGRSSHEMAKCISDFYTQTDIDILRNIAPDVCKLCKVSVAVDKDRALVKETIRQYLPQSVHGIKGRNPPSRF